MRAVAFGLVLLLLIPSIVTATQDEHDWIQDHVVAALEAAPQGEWSDASEKMWEALEDLKPEEFSNDCRQFAYMNAVYMEMMARTADAAIEDSTEEAITYLFTAMLILESPDIRIEANNCRLGL